MFSHSRNSGILKGDYDNSFMTFKNAVQPDILVVHNTVRLKNMIVTMKRRLRSIRIRMYTRTLKEFLTTAKTGFELCERLMAKLLSKETLGGFTMKISWKMKLVYTVMEVLGLMGAIVGGFIYAIGNGFFVLLAGMLIWLGGVFLGDWLYRCPHCGHPLKSRNFGFMPTNHLFTSCPGCGWRVNIKEE